MRHVAAVFLSSRCEKLCRRVDAADQHAIVTTARECGLYACLARVGRLAWAVLNIRGNLAFPRAMDGPVCMQHARFARCAHAGSSDHPRMGSQGFRLVCTPQAVHPTEWSCLRNEPLDSRT